MRIWKFITPIFLALFCSHFAWGQTAEDISLDRLTSSQLRACSGNQFAGSFSIGSIIGQTNDVTTSRMFLCPGDRVQLNHNGNSVFDGDPVPGTAPGVGYAWYECPPDPAFSGSDELATIINDPCVFDLVNTPALGIFIYTDDQNGDAVFSNNAFTQANGMVETIPEYYNNGDPIEIWFAPITYDRLDGSQAAFENNGSCVNVNLNATFSVVYLTPMAIANEQTNIGGDPLMAAFTPVGGLSAFDGSNYTIQIEKSNNASITGTILSGSLVDGDEITYSVPEKGEYTIRIEDGKNCSFVTTMFLGADPVVIEVSGCDTLSPTNLEPGDEFCLPVIVDNFDSILVASLGIVWDASVLEFVTLQNFGSSAIDQSTFGTAFPNAVTMVAFNFPITTGESLPDGTILFEICFRVIAPPGASTSISITDFQNVDVEFANLDGEVPYELIEPQCDISVAQTSNLSAFLTSCGGAPNGDITISAFGGTLPYTYQWTETGSGMMSGPNQPFNLGPMSANFSVPPGNYDVTITDADGTMQTYNVDVGPTLLQIFESRFISPTCYDFTNGNIIVKPMMGTPPYSYIITDLNNPGLPPYSGFILMDGDSAVIPSLPASNYFVEVTDANGCVQIINETLDSNPFIIDILSQSNADCIGVANGAIGIQISGSTPFTGGTYQVKFQQNTVMTNGVGIIGFGALEPGNYTATICGSVPGCDTIFAFTIGADLEITATIMTTDESCEGAADGTVSISGLTNGMQSGSYFTSISDANNNPVGSGTAATFNFSPLDTGIYHVVLDNTMGCLSDTLDFEILPGTGLTITLDTTTLDDCLDVFATGSAVFNVSGGVGPYVYSTNPSAGVQVGDTLQQLNAGNYILTVTDANLCTSELPFTIRDYEDALVGADLISFQIDGTPCFGGSITVLYNGVVPDASTLGVDWVGITDDSTTIEIVDEGQYSVFIFDTDIHCQVNHDTLIECDDVFGVDITTFQPLCNQAAVNSLQTTGSVLIDTFNAVAPVTYFWSIPDTTIDNGFKDNLAPGWYYVTITDALDSTTVDSFEIINPAPSTFAFTQVDSTSCADICDGGVTITPTNLDNDTTEFMFFWDRLGIAQSDTSFMLTADSLCSGFQTFTVSQDGICFYADSFEIPSPLPVTVSLDTAINVTCFNAGNGSIQVSGNGGTGPFTYLWEDGTPGPVINNLSPDTFSIVVTDRNGCTGIDSFFVVQPDSLTATIDSNATTSVGCNGQFGTITVSTSGGTPTYQYQWAPNVSTNAIATNLTQGTYAVTVIDDLGCMDTTSYTVTGSEPITFMMTQNLEAPCFGDPVIFSVDTVSGGSGSGYVFSIQNGPNQEIGTPIPLTIGQYLISISDSTGCSIDTTIFIDHPSQIQVEIVPDKITIGLGESANLFADIVNSEKPIEQFIWSPAVLLTCDTCQSTMTLNAQTQTFTVMAVDSSGCMGEASVLVEISTERRVFIPNVFSPDRNGRNDDFRVFTGTDVQSINSIQIFDRWGELMSRSENIPVDFENGAEAWNGEFKGSNAPPGVYVYLIDITFINGETLVYRGDVTLLR